MESDMSFAFILATLREINGETLEHFLEDLEDW